MPAAPKTWAFYFFERPKDVVLVRRMSTRSESEAKELRLTCEEELGKRAARRVPAAFVITSGELGSARLNPSIRTFTNTEVADPAITVAITAELTAQGLIPAPAGPRPAARLNPDMKASKKYPRLDGSRMGPKLEAYLPAKAKTVGGVLDEIRAKKPGKPCAPGFARGLQLFITENAKKSISPRAVAEGVASFIHCDWGLATSRIRSNNAASRARRGKVEGIYADRNQKFLVIASFEEGTIVVMTGDDL
jgi:hypothetical protein